MAFVRSKMINGYGPYYYLVKSERVGTKVKQIHIAYLGKNAGQKSGTATAATLKSVEGKTINTTYDIPDDREKPQETKKMENNMESENVKIYVGDYKIPFSIEQRDVKTDVKDAYGDVSKIPNEVLAQGREYGWLRTKGEEATYGYMDELRKTVPKPWAAGKTTAIIVRRDIIEAAVSAETERKTQNKKQKENDIKTKQAAATKEAKETGKDVFIRTVGGYDGDEAFPGKEMGWVVVSEFATPDGKIITKDNATY